MAVKNITMKKSLGGGTYDDLYPKTTWAQVESKPSTFTPTSHTHGDISNAGAISSTAVTPASGDYLLISDTGSSGIIKRAIALGSSTTTFLRNDGTWATAGSSSYAGPTDTLLGSRYNAGAITVTDIDTFDEIILVMFGLDPDMMERRLSIKHYPASALTGWDAGNESGATIAINARSKVISGSSFTDYEFSVKRNNADGTSLYIYPYHTATTNLYCYVYGRTW